MVGLAQHPRLLGQLAAAVRVAREARPHRPRLAQHPPRLAVGRIRRCAPGDGVWGEQDGSFEEHGAACLTPASGKEHSTDDRRIPMAGKQSTGLRSRVARTFSELDGGNRRELLRNEVLTKGGRPAWRPK